jgi:hypothetical protein
MAAFSRCSGSSYQIWMGHAKNWPGMVGGAWSGCLLGSGACLLFYMPLAGMTNPPMEWGYPRTVEGFIHAFTRGQYEKANPSDVIGPSFGFYRAIRYVGKGDY